MSRSSNPLTMPLPGEVPLPEAPLDKVITQIRFPTILSIEKGDFVAPFQEAVRSEYPILKSEQIQTLAAGAQGLSHTSVQSIWRFHDTPARKWTLSLASNFLALETSEYTSRTDFLGRLERILRGLAEHIKPGTVDRVGVRYIDRIKGEPYKKIKNLIRPEILGVALTPAESSLGLFISSAVFRYPESDFQLVGRWGKIPEGLAADPALIPSINQPSWILDLDMFSEVSRPFEEKQILEEAKTFCEKIYVFFRWAVTEEFLQYYGGHK